THRSPGACTVLQAARNVGNALNQAQLGISGFHYITTGLNAVISDVALGIQKVASPGVPLATRGQGLLDIAKSPLAPFSQYRAGGALRDAYRGISGSERLADMVDKIGRAHV